MSGSTAGDGAAGTPGAAGAAPVVLVTSRSFGSGTAPVEAELAAAGLRVVRGSTVHDPAELAPLLADAVAWIAGTAPVTDAHLAAAPRLRVVARYGVGVDSVDLAAAARRGVAVTNTPAANSDAVADSASSASAGSGAGWRGAPPGSAPRCWGTTRTWTRWSSRCWASAAPRSPSWPGGATR